MLVDSEVVQDKQPELEDRASDLEGDLRVEGFCTVVDEFEDELSELLGIRDGLGLLRGRDELFLVDPSESLEEFLEHLKVPVTVL